MKTKSFLSVLFMLGMMLSLIPMVGCSKDDDGDGIVLDRVLTVNGKKWDTGLIIPNYDENGFYFICNSSDGYAHTLFFDEDLTDEDIEKGDNVSPEILVLLSENAEYRYEDGEVIVTKCSKKSVTLRFDNYKVRYSGIWESLLPENREDDIINSQYLLINGTVTFYNQAYLN